MAMSQLASMLFSLTRRTVAQNLGPAEETEGSHLIPTQGHIGLSTGARRAPSFLRRAKAFLRGLTSPFWRAMASAALLGLLVVLPLSLHFGSVEAASNSSTGTTAFLEAQLPLTIVLTTPAELSSGPAGHSLEVSGRQAFTVVFSRPVIALGSDFGTEGPFKPAFTLDCPVPGHFRWVSTTIARWDPGVDWPTDLDCTFNWVPNYTAYDGAVLALPASTPMSRKLTSASVQMYVSDVLSPLLDDITRGAWSPTLGLPNDNDPEVPPAAPLWCTKDCSPRSAAVVLHFTYPVHLGKLAAAINLKGGRSANTAEYKAYLTPCKSYQPRYPGMIAPRPGSFSAAASATPAELDREDFCAQVEFEPALKKGERYYITVPHGTKYNKLSGPLRSDVTAVVIGPRPFHFPFRTFNTQQRSNQWINDGTKFRRIDIFTPRGITGKGVDVPSLVPQLDPSIRVCAYEDPWNPRNNSGACKPLERTVTRTAPYAVQISIPGLKPRSLIKIEGVPGHGLMDELGFPLEASSTTFWTQDVQPAFAAPGGGNSGSTVSVFELKVPAASQPVVSAADGADSGASAQPQPLTSWPYASYPGLANAAAQDGGFQVNTAEVWVADLGAPERILALINPRWDTNLRNYMGASNSPVTKISRDKKDPEWRRLELALPPYDPAKANSVLLVHSCCNMAGWPQKPVSAQIQIIVRSSLSAVYVKSADAIMAWVTDTETGGPVKDATAAIYFIPNDQQSLPKLGSSCTTDAQGTCTMLLDQLDNTPAGAPYMYGSIKMVGWVRTKTQALIVPSAGWYSQPSPPPWQGTLVADRLLVRPGDQLKLTGYLQQRVGNKLQLPSEAPELTLRLLNSWTNTGANPRGDAFSGPQVLASPEYEMDAGTFHAIVDVPKNANMGMYSIDFAINRTSDNSSSSQPGEKIDSVSSITVTVADPRPPTAELSMDSPAWVLPTTDVPIKVAATSYIGAQVNNAVVKVSWSISRPGGFGNGFGDVMPAYSSVSSYPGGGSSEGPSGLLELKTDAQGKAEGVIPLAALAGANATKAGDSISVSAEWVGPTRERISKSASIIVAKAPYRLELTRSLDTDLPGINWGLRARLVSVTAGMGSSSDSGGSSDNENADSADSTGVPVVKVKAGIVPRPGLYGLPRDTECDVARSCEEFSTDAPGFPCQLALPCVGTFNLSACATLPEADGGYEVCTSQVVGRNATGWEAEPWRSHDAAKFTLDRQSYRPGDSARLYFTAPWPNSRGLLTWGGLGGVNTRMLEASDLAKGYVDILLGDACVGDCSVMLVISVPRITLPQTLPDGKAYVLPTGVPKSLLFDPLAPFTRALYATLQVRATAALMLEISLHPVGNGGGAVKLPTVETESGSLLWIKPGEKINVKVQVKDLSSGGDSVSYPKADVTLYGVDQSVLDLLPYPLPRIAELMQLQLQSTIEAYGVDVRRVAPGVVQAVFERLMTRLTFDPWLPVDTTCTPMPGNFEGVHSIDVPDQKYASRYSTYVTATTDYGPSACYHKEPYCIVPTFESYSQYQDDTVYGSNGVTSIRNGRQVFFGESLEMAAYTGVAPAAMSAKALGVTAAADNASGARGGAAAMPVAPPGAGGANADSVRLAEEFEATPLFWWGRAESADGVTATFEAPPNLGTFVIRAFVSEASKQRYASTETKLVVRRPLSVTASLPRFVRVGDTFEAGAIVTTPSSAGGTGASPSSFTATLRLELLLDEQQAGGDANCTANGRKRVVVSPLEVVGPASKEVKFVGGGDAQQEIRFSFKATAIGKARLRLSATSDTDNDAVELELEVQGQQGAVDVATTFALRASETAGTWREGLDLPAVVPGSGGLNLTVSVGYLPALAGLVGRAQQEEKEDDYKQARRALVLALGPATYLYYNQPVPEDVLKDAQTALESLSGRLTDPHWGLLPVDPAAWQNWSPSRTDTSLNAYAAWLLDSHSLVMPTQPPPSQQLHEYEAAWNTLKASTVPQWRAAMQRQLIEDAYRARNSPYGGSTSVYSDWLTLAWAHSAMGKSWKVEVCAPGVNVGGNWECAPPDVARDISWERLVTRAYGSDDGFDKVGLSAYLLVALRLQADSDPRTQYVGAALKRLNDLTRVQGRTAYITYSTGGESAASDEAQALGLLLRVRAGEDNQLMSKAAVMVASGPQDLPSFVYCVPYSGYVASLVITTLTAYDTSRSSTTPDLHLNVSVAPPKTPLMAASFTPQDNAPKSASADWSELPEEAKALDFEVSGSGEAVLTASLSFVPQELMSFPSYRGLLVEAVIRATDPVTGDPTGPPLASADLASVVAVTLQVTSPDDVGVVVLDARTPGGLEPLDPNLPGSSSSPAGSGANGGWCDWSIVDPLAITGGGYKGGFFPTSGGFGGSMASSARARTDAIDMPMIEAVPMRSETGRGLHQKVAAGFGGVSGATAKPMMLLPPWGRWPMCPAQETRPSIVKYTWANFPAGTKTVTFKAVAATPGTFVVPPAKAYAVDQPELLGLSAAGSIVVCPGPCPGGPAAAAVAARPRACPKDCLGRGVCNVAEGTCVCNKGYSGADCAIGPPVEHVVEAYDGAADESATTSGGAGGGSRKMSPPEPKQAKRNRSVEKTANAADAGR